MDELTVRNGNGNGHNDLVESTGRSLAQRPGASIQPQNFAECVQCAEWFAAANMFNVKTPAAALMILMTGLELGLSAAQSMRSIYVIEGRTSLSADLISGLSISRRDVCEYFRVVESNEQRAIYVTKRRGDPEVSYTYTIEMATAANLLGKANWKANRSAMLRARCSASLGRMVYPDMLMGLYIPDEDEEIAKARLHGNVISVDEATPAEAPLSRNDEAKAKLRARQETKVSEAPAAASTPPAAGVQSSSMVVAETVAVDPKEVARLEAANGCIAGIAKQVEPVRLAIEAFAKTITPSGDILKFTDAQIHQLTAQVRVIKQEYKAAQEAEKALADKAAAEAAAKKEAEAKAQFDAAAAPVVPAAVVAPTEDFLSLAGENPFDLED
jgi:hypothetical protein